MLSMGREQVIEKILIENYCRYYNSALSYVHNEADALDIVQEGAYKAILKAETLRDEEYASTWIYRIMLNEIFGFCRSRKNYIVEDSIRAESEFGTYDNSSCCAEEMDLYNALSGLSDEEEKIIRLVYFNGLKLKEVADIMGVSQMQISRVERKILEKLRAKV